MERKWLQAVTSAGLALAILGGGAAVMAQSGTGTAQATSGPQGHMQAFLNDVASHLPGGITGSQLLSAVEAAEVDHVNQAVAAGRLTPTQAKRIEARIQSGHIVPGFGRRGPMGRRRRPAVRLILRTAASYLGVSPATLRKDLRGGESLAAVVAGTGNSKLSVSGLEQAITTAVQAKLDKAVQSGRLTSAREARILQNLQNRLERFVNRTPGQRGNVAPAGSGSTGSGTGSTGNGSTGGASSTGTGSPSTGSGTTGTGTTGSGTTGS